MQGAVGRVFEQDRFQRLFEKGVTAWHANALGDAKAAFRAILRDKPNHSETLRFLGLTIRREGQLQVAREMLERAIRALPQNYIACSDLSNIFVELNDLPAARRHAEMALALDSGFADAHANLALVNMREGDLEAAIAGFERALSLNPGCIVSKANLAACRQKLAPDAVGGGEIDQLTALITLEPDNARAHLMLALKLDEQGQLANALIHAYRSCQAEPTPEALAQLGSFLCTLGAFEEGMPIFRQGLDLAPHRTNAGAAYLFAMNYNPLASAEEVFEAYTAYTGKFLQAKRKFRHSPADRATGRKLRIGYSSPDFREHSMFYFITPILAAHDRDAFEIFAYSNAEKYDAKSEEIRGHVDHWIDVTQLSDEQMAERINADGIDVLVDLAGHSRGNRLGVFAMRPAPVQVSYLGYGYTSGLSEIDYFIGDENLTPPEADHLFSENVWRVEAPAYVYRPPPAAHVDVAPLPALRKGHVTFGSMSRLIRINDTVLAAWREILARVPGSRLRLDSTLLADRGTREVVRDRLVKHGFAPEQIELDRSSPHWNGYAEIDIALDCWPHNTGTTTLDALWMGVPVISKLDRPSVGRFGATFLRPLNLQDWIAEDVPGFIDRAVDLASDLDRLAIIRAGLRDRVKASALVAPHLMTRKLEAMCRDTMRAFAQKKAA